MLMQNVPETDTLIDVDGTMTENFRSPKFLPVSIWYLRVVTASFSSTEIQLPSLVF